jgi:hypothetical protein
MLCYHLPQGAFRIDRNALDDALLAAQSPIETGEANSAVIAGDIVRRPRALFAPRPCHAVSATVVARRWVAGKVSAVQLLPSLVRQAGEDQNGRQIRLLLVCRRSVDPFLYLFFIDGQMYRRRFCCRSRSSSPLPWACAAAGPQAAASTRAE